MMQVLMALWVLNRKVYGADKLWRAAIRAGHEIGRDQVARLMREMGIQASAGVAARCSPPSRTLMRRERRTWSTASSEPTGPTRCGSPI